MPFLMELFTKKIRQTHPRWTKRAASFIIFYIFVSFLLLYIYSGKKITEWSVLLQRKTDTTDQGSRRVIWTSEVPLSSHVFLGILLCADITP